MTLNNAENLVMDSSASLLYYYILSLFLDYLCFFLFNLDQIKHWSVVHACHVCLFNWLPDSSRQSLWSCPNSMLFAGKCSWNIFFQVDADICQIWWGEGIRKYASHCRFGWVISLVLVYKVYFIEKVWDHYPTFWSLPKFS